MMRMPVLPRSAVGGICLANDKLPPFYMEDFSVMGIRVPSLEPALDVLAAGRYAVALRKGYAEVDIPDAAMLPEIVRLLAKNGISCDLGDISDHMYQG